jgi:hypothetical protein
MYTLYLDAESEGSKVMYKSQYGAVTFASILRQGFRIEV